MLIGSVLQDAWMPKPETDTRRILQRLLAEGWVIEAGSKHTKLFHPNRRGVKIILPRRRTQSLGIGRAVAKDAGWL